MFRQGTPTGRREGVIHDELRRVHARVADEQERAELWPRLVDLYADFANYQAWTDRVIPVVILEPR